MPYITHTDIDSLLREVHLRELLDVEESADLAADEKLNICISFAEENVRINVISANYDEAEFLKTGADRNPMLIEWMVKLAIYSLYRRTSSSLPEVIVKDEEEVRKQFQYLLGGMITLGIPKKDPNKNPLFIIDSSERPNINVHGQRDGIGYE